MAGKRGLFIKILQDIFSHDTDSEYIFLAASNVLDRLNKQKQTIAIKGGLAQKTPSRDRNSLFFTSNLVHIHN